MPVPSLRKVKIPQYQLQSMADLNQLCDLVHILVFCQFIATNFLKLPINGRPIAYAAINLLSSIGYLVFPIIIEYTDVNYMKHRCKH